MIGTCTISLRVWGLADEGTWLGLGCRSTYQSEYLALGSQRWAWERTSLADCTHGLPLRPLVSGTLGGWKSGAIYLW
jgi:hypothetical protein